MSGPIRLRGDLHAHTAWSDGKASMEARARRESPWAPVPGHHGPLARAEPVVATVGRERLLRQWDEIDSVRERVGLRLLRGIEVVVLASGALDQADDPRTTRRRRRQRAFGFDAESATMTRPMITAIANPHTTILGHCTGRKRRPDGTWRALSRFDADLVFATCASSAWRSRSTLAQTVTIHQMTCSPSPWKRAACSPSDPMRTPRPT